MTAASILLRRAGDGASFALAFDAAGEAAGIAESYARAAGEFAALGDHRGLAYALRQAALAISSAADAAATLRSPHGRRAASC